MKKLFTTPLVVLLINFLVIGIAYLVFDPADSEVSKSSAILIVSKILIVGVLALIGYIDWKHCFSFGNDLGRTLWIPLFASLIGMVGIDLLNDIVDLKSTLPTSNYTTHTAWTLLASVLVGPIAEEICFREAVTGRLLRKGANPVAAIVIGAAAFSIIHLNPSQYIPTFLIGIVFGIVYWKTNNVVIPCLVHIIHNGLNKLMLLHFDFDPKAASYQMIIGKGLPSILVMVLCLATASYLLFRFIKRKPVIRNKGSFV